MPPLVKDSGVAVLSDLAAGSGAARYRVAPPPRRKLARAWAWHASR